MTTGKAYPDRGVRRTFAGRNPGVRVRVRAPGAGVTAQVHHLAPGAVQATCGAPVMGGTQVTERASAITCPECSSIEFYRAHGPVVSVEPNGDQSC